jgi:hypothetical protein
MASPRRPIKSVMYQNDFAEKDIEAKMISKRNYIQDDWLFYCIKLLIVLAIIIIFGYLFCIPSACY